MQNQIWKIIIYQSFINKLSSVQHDFSTKHTAWVKPSQYIAQHLYEQKSKSNCSSCSSHTSYIGASKVFSLRYAGCVLIGQAQISLVDIWEEVWQGWQCQAGEFQKVVDNWWMDEFPDL